MQGFGILDNGEIIGDNLSETDKKLLKLKYDEEQSNAGQEENTSESFLIANPINYYKIGDTTKELNEFMLSTEYMYKDYKKLPLAEKMFIFKTQVEKDSQGDLKSKAEYANPLYIYNNEIVDRDALYKYHN